MNLVKEVTETVNSLRKENSIKLRWPTEKIIIETKDENTKKTIIQFSSVFMATTNAKKIEIGYGEGNFVSKDFSKGKVFVSKNVIKDEALLRELLREIQEARKARKLVINDKIVLFLDNEIMKKFIHEIKEKVGANEIKFCSIEGEFGSVKLEDCVVRFKFTPVK